MVRKSRSSSAKLRALDSSLRSSLRMTILTTEVLARDGNRRGRLLFLFVSRPVLDPYRRAHEAKGCANLVLQKTLIGEMQFHRPVGEQDERRRRHSYSPYLHKQLDVTRIGSQFDLTRPNRLHFYGLPVLAGPVRDTLPPGHFGPVKASFWLRECKRT